jgi:hypothetical protein
VQSNVIDALLAAHGVHPDSAPHQPQPPETSDAADQHPSAQQASSASRISTPSTPAHTPQPQPTETSVSDPLPFVPSPAPQLGDAPQRVAPPLPVDRHGEEAAATTDVGASAVILRDSARSGRGRWAWRCVIL